jgi:hypothetical protein
LGHGKPADHAVKATRSEPALVQTM